MRNPIPAALMLRQQSSSAAVRDLVFSVNSIRYLAGSQVEHWNLGDLFDNHDDFSLVTILDPAANPADDQSTPVTLASVRETVQRYETDDDVFQKAFLSTVILLASRTSGDSHGSITDEAHRYLREQGAQSIHHVKRSSLIEPGPYVVLQHRLCHVWRLYDDTHGAFMTAVRPQEGPFEELKLLGKDPSFSAVAVPSRITRQPTQDKPMNGMRFAVKDIYHLKGLRTSFGSRSYYNIYGPQPETASAVTKLQNLGAVVLGKLKMTQFGAWEEPIESIDYQAPWNPRADGFQSPAGSSSGPVCALAAYPWIDFTLGSDATGSIPRPGLWAGLFALRPTWQAVSYEGIGGPVEELAMAGCFSRSLKGLWNLSNLWLDHKKLLTGPKKFTSIVWPSDMWDPVDQDQQALARKFVNEIESCLDIKTLEVSFDQVWDDNRPSEANGASLADYINDACDQLFYEVYLSFKDFISKHREKFGFPPYLSPPSVADWKMFASLTEEDYQEAVKRLNVYRRWFRTEIFESDDHHKLFVLPIEYLAPRYRDEVPDFRRPGPGVNSLTLSPVMKAPEVIVPIGEIPYHSRITDQEEKLPFAVGVMGLPGTDLQILEVLQKVMEENGRPVSVHTGKWMYKAQDKPSWLGGSSAIE